MAFERRDGRALQFCERAGDEPDQGYEDRFRETTFRNRSGKQSPGCFATRAVDVRFLANSNGTGKGFGLCSRWCDRCAEFISESFRQLCTICADLCFGLSHFAYWLAGVSAAIECALILECAGRAQRRRRFGWQAAVVSEPRAVATGPKK